MTTLLQFTSNSEKSILKLVGLIPREQCWRRQEYFCSGRSQVVRACEVGNTRLGKSAQDRDGHIDIALQRVSELHLRLHFDVPTLSQST